MTTHGFYRESHHVEHATSQEGERGASGRWGEGQGAHACQHTCMHTWGMGRPRADALPWTGSSAHPNGLKSAAMTFQNWCWPWGAWGHWPPAMQQPPPSDSSAAVVVALLFGQAGLTRQSNALTQGALCAETCALPPSWAGSSHGPDLRPSVPETARHQSKPPRDVSTWVVLPRNITWGRLTAMILF